MTPGNAVRGKGLTICTSPKNGGLCYKHDSPDIILEHAVAILGTDYIRR